MKLWKCEACGKEIEVPEEYDPEYCCHGRMEDACGCMGRPINPMFCDDCEVKIFGRREDNEK